MLYVTGGAGFIGSNIVERLAAQNNAAVTVVDDLTDGRKALNLADLIISDFLDKDKFITGLRSGDLQQPTAVIHMGACSSTTEWDGKFMMESNYEYSKQLLHYCSSTQTQFIYASSASVYGANETFLEKPEFEKPLNVYGYSKLLFDQYVRQKKWDCQVVGLRFFNVYGPREAHKLAMASVVLHAALQVIDNGSIKLFGANDGYEAGEQKRDFVFVDDCVNVVEWFLKNPDKSGIFNCGTGKPASFNNLANAVIRCMNTGGINYVEFPDKLKGKYQSWTCANLSALRAIGYERKFVEIDEGVERYIRSLALSDMCD